MERSETEVECSTEQYFEWMYRNEKSAATIEKYRNHIKSLIQFAAGRPLTKGIIIEWKRSMKNKLAPSTVNAALSAANGFFSYMRWDEFHVRLLKIGQDPFYPEEKELSKQEYEKMVLAAYGKGKERLAMVIQTICALGIRVSELQFVTAEAVTKGVALVENKGRIRKVYFPQRLLEELERYMDRHHIESGCVFVTRNGRALDRSNIWREMKRLSESAQVEDTKIFPLASI